MLDQLFLQFAASRLGLLADRIAHCIELLPETALWHRQHAAENSVGNLLLHLHGNLGQFLLSSLGGTPDTRRRDAEFNAAGGFTKTELLVALRERVAACQTLLSGLTVAQLEASYEPQPGRHFKGLELIFMAVTHFDEHAGQIYWVTKRHTGQPLNFTTHNPASPEEPELPRR